MIFNFAWRTDIWIFSSQFEFLFLPVYFPKLHTLANDCDNFQAFTHKNMTLSIIAKLTYLLTYCRTPQMDIGLNDECHSMLQICQASVELLGFCRLMGHMWVVWFPLQHWHFLCLPLSIYWTCDIESIWFLLSLQIITSRSFLFS